MSIQNVTSTQARAQGRRAAPGSGTAGPSFQERLSAASAPSAEIQGPGIQLYMGADFVCSGCKAGHNGFMQEVHAQYTADSTPQDPIVRIFGTSDSGPYEFTCHIRDIDPSGASYAELAALYGWLQKTGAYQGGLTGLGALPVGMDPGDVTVKRDWTAEIRAFQASGHVPGQAARSGELLTLYQGYAGQGGGAASGGAALSRESFVKPDLLAALAGARNSILDRMREEAENEKEQRQWEALLQRIDRWIESLRESSETQREIRGEAGQEAGARSAELEYEYIAHVLDSLRL